jgi:ketosteroid isomerase-like protein
MAERSAARGLDLETFRRAAEGKDPDSMLGLYADDAEYVRVDRNSTPSSPMALRGKEKISEYLRDVFSRDMTHSIENEVLGEERAAFNWACEYSDGTKVLSAETVELRDGKIVRQVSVQAWDE